MIEHAESPMTDREFLFVSVMGIFIAIGVCLILVLVFKIPYVSTY